MAQWAILQRGKKGSDPVAAEYAPVPGYRPLPGVAAPWQQKGLYGDQYLSQFPAYYNQPQLHSGTDWLAPGMYFYTPTVSVLPTFEQSQRPANIAGAQRFASGLQSPLGPLSARALFARVTQAQVSQSGASALSWASQLSSG
jgi:hypothetical protein